MERRLAAILAADVVGYSRLMGDDEAGTLAALTHLRKDLIEPLIAEHRGRIVKLMGDGILAEFASVVDAMACAVAWQDTVAARSEEPRIAFRIGVNLGDIIFEGDDIHGNGVNVAARLEGLAEPGGICLSAAVHGEVRNKIDLAFEDMGDQEVKNIAEPLRAYRVVLKGGRQSGPVAGSVARADKPSVAVLPFDNMSGDPDQEAFVDGMTEDIITALSRNRWFQVTARNSTFAYKGRSPDVREVARALGVGYVLEGSVRRGGQKARITAQLIEAGTGNHVWAERFDRAIDDEFEIQDEIARRVSSVLGERIWQDVAKTIVHKSPENYGPFEHAFRAIEYIHRLEPDSLKLAESHLRKALEVDPDLPVAYLGLGFCQYLQWVFCGDPSGRALEEAERHAVRLRELAPDDAQTYRLLSRVYNAKGMYDEAWRCVERALAINPNDGDIIANRGVFHLFQGDLEEAVQWIDKVLELHLETPHTVDIMHSWKALAAFAAGDGEGALAELRKIGGLDYLKALLFAACHAQLGRQEEANTKAEAVLRANPHFRLGDIGYWKLFRQEADRQHLLSALRAAGLPD